MPTFVTHAAATLGLFPWFRDASRYKVILLAGLFLAVLPDADAISFKLGIPYKHLFGHRGFSHSLFFALLTSVPLAWWITKRRGVKFAGVWFFLFLCGASHGVLDALTSGGEGVAFFAPFSNERYFLPWRPIRVSPLSIKRFITENGLTERGLAVLLSELKWVWLPAVSIFGLGFLFRRRGGL